MFESVEEFEDSMRESIEPRDRGPSYSNLPLFLSLVERNRARSDIVHICSQRFAFLARDFRKDCMTVHDVFPFGLRLSHHHLWKEDMRDILHVGRNRFFQFTMNRVAKGRFATLSDSAYTKSSLVREFGFNPEFVSVVPFPLAPEFKRLSKTEARQRLRLPLEGNIVLSSSSDIARKNIGALYYSINNLKTKALFLRMGPIDWSQITPARREWVIHRDFVDINDLPLFYSASDVLFFPSCAEGFGVPLVEAMTAGIPIVASSSTSIPEVAQDSALIADPHDFTRLTQLLEEVLSSDEIRARLGSRGILLSGTYSSKSVFERIEAVYGGLGRR